MPSARSAGTSCSVAARTRTMPPARSALVLGQLALEDLAGRVARQLLHEDDVARDLVAREVRLHVILQLRLGGVAPGVEDDERAQALTELLVLDADDGDLADGLVR